MPKILSIDMTSVAKPDCVPSTKPDYIPSSKFGSANELFKVSTKKLVAPVKVSKKNLSLPSSKRSAKPRQPFVRKQAILNALARLKGGGAVAPPKDTVGLVAGCFPMEQPSFDKAIREMINKGWLTTTSTGLMLTAAGEAKVPTHITLDPILSNHEILSAVEESLTPKKKGIFQLLSNGFEYLREDVAEAVGYKAETISGFNKVLSAMARQGIVESLDREVGATVRLGGAFFPFGRNQVHTFRPQMKAAP